MKKTLSSVIRILTIPPILVSALVLILYFRLHSEFATVGQCIIMILLLGVVPVLAYPLQKYIPSFKDKGRDGQRKLAFIFTLIGYTLALIWALACGVGTIARTICITYFVSVVLLTIINKVIKFKASGHSGCITVPILLLTLYTDRIYIIPGILLLAAVFWSSLSLKRHTASQLIGGVAAAVAAVLISVLLFGH